MPLWGRSALAALPACLLRGMGRSSAGQLCSGPLFCEQAWRCLAKVKVLSRVRLFATPWTVAYPAPPSMGFSRQEYWSGLPLVMS